MKVMLQRNLFLADVRYRQNNSGTEIPEYIQILNEDSPRKVVLAKDFKDPKTEIALPKDATLFDEKVVTNEVKLFGKVHKTSQKQKPMALSQLPKLPSAEEMLEKKK